MRGPLMLANDYANRFGVKLALKDVRLGCEMGDVWGYSAEFTKFEKADNEGYGMEDCVAVYKVIK
jgi:3-hydroxyisobutyrate dehydrogenase-like beta-hydroxyacid dehydrogenase